MSTLTFSNGITIDSSQILRVESNQQSIAFPGGIGELAHLLLGRPSGLLIRLRDGSTVQINAGSAILKIQSQETAN